MEIFGTISMVRFLHPAAKCQQTNSCQ
uniref:Uncharacterized protein n=1 Tax=Anopheles minimus TaxID=112268 RepID=A0A182WPI2_9DIPT